MNRIEKILAPLNMKGKGLEIGPSHNPVAPKKDGYDVEIIDHLSKEGLIEKYQGHNIEFGNIEDVDYVWSGETYAELTGKPGHYDWVIASHVIEHTPDLIGFLMSCNEVVKDDGVISLVVPDMRYCFDYFRSPTSLGQVLDAHYEKRVRHTPGSLVEFSRYFAEKDGVRAWADFSEGECTFVNSLESVRSTYDHYLKSDEYIDVHAWCLTPNLFRLILLDLYDLGVINFREVGYFPSVGCEFFVSLSRNGKGPDVSREKLAAMMKADFYEKRNSLPITLKRLANRVRRIIK